MAHCFNRLSCFFVLFAVVLVSLNGVAQAVSPPGRRLFSAHDYQVIFSQWKVVAKKKYSDQAEEAQCLEKFKDNVDQIVSHNLQPNHTYTMALNDFGKLVVCFLH